MFKVSRIALKSTSVKWGIFNAIVIIGPGSSLISGYIGEFGIFTE